jgi:ABC-type sugar transport system permease subunit
MRRTPVKKISRLGHEARLGWTLVAPALSVIALIAIFPLGWTFWESLHLHELRMPWLGKPFVGLANYVEIAKDPRFWAALGHTAFFTVVSISLELVIGLFLALMFLFIRLLPMISIFEMRAILPEAQRAEHEE